MKNIIIVLVVLVLFCNLSCKKQSTKTLQPIKNSNSKLTIGFSIDTFIIERWQRECDIFTANAQNQGANVIVQIAGNSAEKQNEQIRSLINKGVDALVIVPKESESLSASLRLAKENNIPVISYDRLILNSDISLYITIDSTKVGYLMAEELLKRVPSGRYLCIYGPKEDYNMLLVREGVKSVLQGLLKINITEEYYTLDWNFDMAYLKTKDVIASKIIPDAVICGNDAIAGAVLSAFSEEHISGIVLSGQDADIAACQRIVEGSQAMTVYKPITELAKTAADMAVLLAKKIDISGSIEKTVNNGLIDVPSIMLEPISVTKDNIDKVIVESAFHTKEEVYR